ncbi:hypothetical protein K1T71_004263, partial [Dendrolimus kikuchii]
MKDWPLSGFLFNSFPFVRDFRAGVPFWGQFQKTNDDESLDASDKFQYLIQAMTQGTEHLIIWMKY